MEKIPNCKVFFLSNTSKPNQQKQRDVVLKSAANIYPPIKYDFFPVILLLTNHEALFNLGIVLSFHPPFEPISALLQLQLISYICFIIYQKCLKLHS